MRDAIQTIRAQIEGPGLAIGLRIGDNLTTKSFRYFRPEEIVVALASNWNTPTNL